MRKFPLRGALSRSLAHPTRKCKGYGERLSRNAPRTKSRGENAEARSTLPQRSDSKTTFHKNADAREQPCKTQRALYAPRAARARAHLLFKKILRGRFGPSPAALERKAQTCPAGSLRAAKRKILYINSPRGASTPRPRAPERNRKSIKKTPKIGENCTAFPLFGWQIAYNVRCLAAAAPPTRSEHSSTTRPREKPKINQENHQNW